ncbi:MAG TPA: S-layer homology domain-containing protein [Clostridia bacterium]|nr:S-layer homology domain-containing protein [Clostridia bacterium]
MLLLVIGLSLFFSTGYLQAAESDTGPPFRDLDVTDESFRYVRFLQSREIINGYPDGTFQPYGPLTRAEAAKIIITSIDPPLDLPVNLPEEPSYSDVSPEHWAYPYIETATSLGLLTGYPDGTFQPQRQLTRAETAMILFRIYGVDYQWSGASLAVDLPQWAYDAVNSIIDAGLMGTDAEKRFQPDWPATRVEFARAFALLHTIHEDWRLVPLKATLVPKTGVVQVQKPGQKPVTVSGPIELAVDDLIITGNKAEAEIRFEDGSGMLLQPNSEMKVLKLVGSLFILPDGSAASAVEDLEVQFLRGTMFGALASRGVEGEALLQEAGAGNWTRFPLLALAGDDWAAAGYADHAALTTKVAQVEPIDENSEAFKQLPPVEAAAVEESQGKS